VPRFQFQPGDQLLSAKITRVEGGISSGGGERLIEFRSHVTVSIARVALSLR